MNCIIIHSLRTRVKFNVTISDTKTDCENKRQRKGQSQGHDKGQSSKMQNTERQIYIMLLLVTFGFLILLTPAYAFYLYQMFYDYDKSLCFCRILSVQQRVAKKPSTPTMVSTSSCMLCRVRSSEQIWLIYSKFVKLPKICHFLLRLWVLLLQ